MLRILYYRIIFLFCDHFFFLFLIKIIFTKNTQIINRAACVILFSYKICFQFYEILFFIDIFQKLFKIQNNGAKKEKSSYPSESIVCLNTL